MTYGDPFKAGTMAFQNRPGERVPEVLPLICKNKWPSSSCLFFGTLIFMGFFASFFPWDFELGTTSPLKMCLR